MSLTLTLCLFCAVVMDARAAINVSPKMGDERCKKADSEIAKPSASLRRQHWTTWGDPQEFRCNGHVRPFPPAP